MGDLTAEVREARRLRVVAAAVEIVYFDLDADDLDEDKLSPDAGEALKGILALEGDEGEASYTTAQQIRTDRRTDCPTCDGTGLAVLFGRRDICACVRTAFKRRQEERRQQVAAEGNGPMIPGRQERNAAKEKTDRDRLIKAREVLARARQDQATACADLDKQIGETEKSAAAYLTERARLVAIVEEATTRYQDRAVRTEVAEEEARTAFTAAEGSRVEIHDRIIATRTAAYVKGQPAELPARRAARKDAKKSLTALLPVLLNFLDTGDTAQARADVLREEAAAAQQEAMVAQTSLTDLDDANAEVRRKLDLLRTSRKRIAGHHQDKIDTADRRERRLAYLCGERLPE